MERRQSLKAKAKTIGSRKHPRPRTNAGAVQKNNATQVVEKRQVIPTVVEDDRLSLQSGENEAYPQEKDDSESVDGTPSTLGVSGTLMTPNGSMVPTGSMIP